MSHVIHVQLRPERVSESAEKTKAAKMVKKRK